MYFNSHQSIKTSERKILRKVKKNWVVLSLSFLTALGTDVLINQQDVAHADIVASNSSSTNNSSGESASSQNASLESQANDKSSVSVSDSTSGSSSSISSNASSFSNNVLSSFPNVENSGRSTSSNVQNISSSTNTLNDSSNNESLSLDLRTSSPENNNANINQSLKMTEQNNGHDVNAQLTDQVPSPSTTVTISKNQNSTSMNIFNSATSPYPQTVHLYATDIFASPNNINTIIQNLNHNVTLSLNQNNLNTPSSAVTVASTEYNNLNKLILDSFKYQVGNGSLKDVPLKGGDSVSFNANVSINDPENKYVVNFNYIVMSTPVIKVSYVDSSGNAVGTKYLTSDNITPGKSFQTNLNISGYQFTKGDPKIKNNYSSSNDKYNLFNDSDSYKTVNDPNQSDNNNDSNLSLNYIDNQNATLNGVFASLSTGPTSNNSNDYSLTYPNNLINEIDIPVEKISDQPTKPITQPINQNKPVPISTFPTNSTYVPTYNEPAFSLANNVVSSVASSSANASSAASSTATQYYEMYNYKTRLVKRNGTIHIFIQPRYTDNDTNGNLKHRDVVTITNENGKVTHDQEVTLDQYNAMLSASGKTTFTPEQLQQAYVKRHRKYGIMRDKTHKTTFVSPITKQGNNVLIDTSGEQKGFYSTKDHYLVEDTDDLRVKISKHGDKVYSVRKHQHKHKQVK